MIVGEYVRASQTRWLYPYRSISTSKSPKSIFHKKRILQTMQTNLSVEDVYRQVQAEIKVP